MFFSLAMNFNPCFEKVQYFITAFPRQEAKYIFFLVFFATGVQIYVLSAASKEGFLGGSMVKSTLTNSGDMGPIDPWAGKIPWRKKWQPTPVVLPGESHGQRTLVGYSSWGLKRVRQDLATTEQQQNCLKKLLLENFNILK